MKDDSVYLLHIRDAIQRAIDYTGGGREAFLADARTQDAVIRNIEVIGEAVKQLSDGLKKANAGIPWKQIAGMRDTLIHRYFGVKLDLVWQVVESDLPNLLVRVNAELASSNIQPLTLLHQPELLNPAKLLELDKLPDDVLIASLQPGQASSLKARPDGTVLDGHHRLKILRDRGIDVDSLPRETIPRS